MPDTTAAKPFFRADQVGSLLRTPALLDARARASRGEIGPDELTRLENEEIAAILAHQEACGLHAVTDGEFRRENWWIDFIDRIDGIEIYDQQDDQEFKRSSGEGSGYKPKLVRVVSKIRRTRPLTGTDYAFLRDHSGETPKLTIPSPTRVHVLGGDAAVDRAIYPDIEDFWSDLVAVYQEEIAALEAEGCRYIQIDDPYLANFIDETQRARLEAVHGDLETLLARYVDVLNRCMEARQPSTHLALHICRGNARSAWTASGGYEPIAEAALGGLTADTLFLEFDDDRSGGFEPLRHVRPGVNVVLGLVTSKRPELEDPSTLKARIAEAAKYVPLERLALSPQCGFASTVDGNLVTQEDQWKKLALVADVAKDVWQDA